MRQFVELNENNTVRVIFEWPLTDRVPEFAPILKQPVEITGLDPQPEVGWTYDGTTFHAP